MSFTPVVDLDPMDDHMVEKVVVSRFDDVINRSLYNVMEAADDHIFNHMVNNRGQGHGVKVNYRVKVTGGPNLPYRTQKLPRRKHTIYRTRRKFEIKKRMVCKRQTNLHNTDIYVFYISFNSKCTCELHYCTCFVRSKF